MDDQSQRNQSFLPRRVVLIALLAVALLVGCTVPGRLVATPTTDATPGTPAALATTTEPATPVASATPTATRTATAAGTPTSTRAATAATTRRTATTASPTRGTPTSARATPNATREPFTATRDQPCNQTDFDQKPLPEKKATVATIEQGYRCLLLNYVDKHTMDHRVLLNGSWSYLAQAGQGLFTAEDTAALALTGDREADWAVFEERFNALARKYRAVDTSILARVALDGMARGLNDNHVFYLEPKLWQRSYAQSTGENVIISPGFDLAVDDATGRFYLYSVYPKTAAAKAGLKAGDIINTVGGRPARKGEGNQALYNLLTGAIGTKAQMQVTRPATRQTVRAEVVVEQVEVPLIESRTFPGPKGKIGYLKLRNFSNNSGEEFDKALNDLEQEGIVALIFDVRQNPGGSVGALSHILSHFTHQSPIGVTTDADGKREEVELDQSVPLLGLPWVVLANGSSASSADITAAVAKARGGYLIGEKTSGSLGGAYLYELEDGSALEITAYRVVGPDGEEINNVGVTPHEVVALTPADLSAENDPQLQRALDYLASK